MPNLIPTLGKLMFAPKKRKLPEKINRILFLKTGALGDIIMTTPLVRAVRKKFPNAVIDYACGSSYAGALRGNIYLNYVIEFDEDMFYGRKFKEMKCFSRRLKENRYDIIFVLDRHWAVGVFASFAGSFRIGFDRYGEGFANNLNIKYRQNKHDILSYLDLAIYIRARQEGLRPDVFVSEKDRSFARKVCKKNTVVIAPGGGINPGQRARIKIWPKQRFLKVTDEISKNYRIILAGGQGDKPICSWIFKRSKKRGKIRNLCGKTSVQQTAAILEKSRLVICNDSGIMHIASCKNDKIISLFGPTDPRVLAPMSLKSTYIWKEKKACYDIFGNFSKCEKGVMNKISVEDVIYAAKKYLRL